MNIAHFFTLIRLVLSPLFPLLYLKYEWFGLSFGTLPYVLLTLLLVCECSDLFDGFFARRHNIVTDLGKILDPIADSVTHITIFFMFTQGVFQLPLMIVFVFLYRELLIGGLRTLCALRGFTLAARFSGKVKAVLQGVVCALMIALMIPYSKGYIPLETLQSSGFVLAGLVALYTVISVADYTFANREYIRNALRISALTR